MIHSITQSSEARQMELVSPQEILHLATSLMSGSTGKADPAGINAAVSALMSLPSGETTRTFLFRLSSLADIMS